MPLFRRSETPVFLKSDSSAEEQLAALRSLLDHPNGLQADAIEQDIRILEAGVFGEETIRYELENSHIFMYVLHDLYLEHEGLSAQIDYLIITRRHIYVVECKNLLGDIEINSRGDFIRTINYGKHRKKEGIYSPITQNRRHLELIRQIRAAEKGNILSKAMFEKSFYDNYRSIVVLSNPRSLLNDRYAKKAVRNQVIRADQLSAYIRKTDAATNAHMSDKDMEELAQFFLRIHQPQQKDYAAKYRTAAEPPVPPPADAVPLCPRCGAAMVRRKATKGPYAGKEFFGCSSFPRCKCIIQLSDAP